MFNYVQKRNTSFTISIAIILAGIIAYAIFGGFNADIDFTGGYTMTVEVATTKTMQKIDAVEPQQEVTPEAPSENAEAEAPVENAENTENAQTTENTEDAQAQTQEVAPNEEQTATVGFNKSEIITGEDITKVKDSFVCNEDAVAALVAKNVKTIDKANVVKTDTGFIVKFRQTDDASIAEVKKVLANEYGQIKIISEDKVSATVGSELWGNASKALIIAAVLMLLYITIRFEFLSGVSAVVALIHDLLVMMSVYLIFRLPINTSFVAAMLTILGYSINATIVIFDRIRENAKLEKSASFDDVTNKSISQTLTRAINTSITTLITIVMVYILGVTSVKEFALPIIIGIVCGTYSSIFIAGPVWAMFKGMKNKKERR